MAIPWGAFMLKVLPFGMAGGPATFQRQMDITFRDMAAFAAPYMDDVIVFSRGPEDHLRHLAAVLGRLQAEKFYCNASKCVLGERSLVFCGFRVDQRGVSPVTSWVDEILSWPQPKNVKALRSFLGLCVFFKRFLIGFSDMAAPLHALLKKGAT